MSITEVPKWPLALKRAQIPQCVESKSQQMCIRAPDCGDGHATVKSALTPVKNQ